MDSEHDSDLEVKPEDLETDHEDDMEDDANESASSEDDNESDDEQDEDGGDNKETFEFVEDEGDDDAASMDTEEGEHMEFKNFAEKIALIDDEFEENEEGEEEGESNQKGKVYVPGIENGEGPIDPDDLEFDKSAYVVYERVELGLPCLSFDVIQDDLGSGEARLENWPLSTYFVTGTQAPPDTRNKIMLLKLSNLKKLKQDSKKKEEGDEDIIDSEEDEEEDEDDPKSPNAPKLSMAAFPHESCVNRIRSTSIGNNKFAASWSENGSVYIWDLTKAFSILDDPGALESFNKQNVKPCFTFKGHKMEGFAMDWSPLKKGLLATGDCDKYIHIWRPKETMQWNIDNRPLMGHKASVEDLQWSPSEDNVLASCSVDKSIRIWDIRAKPTSACMLSVQEAHQSDINVISWNRNEQSLIVSGGDDGFIKTWDLRHFGGKGKVEPIANLKHHTAPITSIEWCPTDSSVFAASGEDNQITIWDLAVEKDDEDESDDEEADDELKKLPPQLLFIHQGASELKELHFHSQIPGFIISTAATGFDVFKTISV